MSGVYLEIEGVPVPAKDCVWIDTAPCGCISGVMTAESCGEVTTSVEQAMARYYEHKVIGKRYEDDGFVLSLTTHEAFRAMAMDPCPHEPRWGVAAPEPPEGWTWGTNDHSWGRQTHIKHMVPIGSITVPGEPWPEQFQVAQCGVKPKGAWWRDVDQWVDCVPCRKCETAVTAP